MIFKVKEIAQNLLDLNPDPVIEYKILTEIIELDKESPQYKDARKNLIKSKNVRQLEKSQFEDGSWGTFHGGKQVGKKQVWTTEMGVQRAVVLGLDKEHKLLKKVTNYIEKVFEKKIDIPDYPEKNDRWESGKNLFLSSTLSLINKEHPIVKEAISLWEKIVCKVFISGKYNQEAEINAHKELTGATVKDSYLTINNKYSLMLLGRSKSQLRKRYEKPLLEWLFKREDGIGYQNAPLNTPPISMRSGFLDRLFNSQEILSNFDVWRHFAGDFIEWIWQQRKEDGFWDFGPRVNTGCSYYFPLSENWSKRINGKIDWTTRVLILLSKYNKK